MGVLADFIVANEAEAAAYDGTASIRDSHRAQYKTFTEIELGTLYHIAHGKEVDDDTLYAIAGRWKRRFLGLPLAHIASFCAAN